METIPCIANKCLKYPICKHKESLECGELHIYYRKLYVHYKKDSNQLNQHDTFNKIHSKVIKHLQTSLPNLKVITGMWDDIYTEHIHKGFPSLKGITKLWNNSYAK